MRMTVVEVQFVEIAVTSVTSGRGSPPDEGRWVTGTSSVVELDSVLLSHRSRSG